MRPSDRLFALARNDELRAAANHLEILFENRAHATLGLMPNLREIAALREALGTSLQPDVEPTSTSVGVSILLATAPGDDDVLDDSELLQTFGGHPAAPHWRAVCRAWMAHNQTAQPRITHLVGAHAERSPRRELIPPYSRPR